MDNGAHIQWLADGRRLHLQHGPIDLVVEARGGDSEVRRAYEKLCALFPSILPDLVDELVYLRKPLNPYSLNPDGVVAKKMVGAASPHAKGEYVTPMIAVAGAVADCALEVMLAGQQLDRVYVNNGGDVALFLGDGEHFDIGVCENPNASAINSTVRIESQHGIGGIATSGWRGRSHSLGIADAVTVLAHNAANADVAATLIANAVDLPGSNKISRTAASELYPDSDLGSTPVTVNVDALNPAEIKLALQSGVSKAQKMLRNNQIDAAFISLQGDSRVVGKQATNMPTALCRQQFNQKLTGAMHA